MNILFLCATNAVLSPMAEALLKRIDSENFQVVSAGFEHLNPHGHTASLLNEMDLHLKDWSPRLLSSVVGQNFDMVITLGDRAPSMLPFFPNVEHAHWRFDDPSTLMVDQHKNKLLAIRDQIAQRIRLLVLVHMRATKQAREGSPPLTRVS